MSLFSTTAGLHTVRMCALARTRPCFGPRDPGRNTVDVTLAVSTGARDSASDYRQKPVSNLTYQQGCRRNRNNVSQLHGPSACTVQWSRGARSDRADEAELLEGSHTIVQADLLGDFAVLDAEH